MYLDSTPIETYKIGAVPVHVKRDDLFALPPAPQLGKLRGLRAVLPRLRSEGRFHIGCFEAHHSQVGVAVAAACANEVGFSCTVVYPQFGNAPLRETVLQAKSLGAQVVPVRGNHVPINHNQAKKIVEAGGGWMIPFGFEFEEAVQAVSTEARLTPSEFVNDGTVIVPCGSGVTLAGVVKGLWDRANLFVGVSVGRSSRGIVRCLRASGIGDLSSVEIIEPKRSYGEKCESSAPFPCDEYYDLKAWSYLSSDISKFKDAPILFWNVGG